jgi:hypothetical protein
MPVISTEAAEDPIGAIVGLIAERDPSLDQAVIAKVAEEVAGGRSKRRRLAQALLDRPGVLADGRSPAPRAVADLLIALRTAGATGVSPPTCAECGKHLRTFQRRGDDWFCAVCGPVREPCTACGSYSPSAAVTATGNPGAPSARPAISVIPSEWSRRSSPASTRRCRPRRWRQQWNRRSRGPGSDSGSPGRWRTGPGCSPGKEQRPRSRQSFA